MYLRLSEVTAAIEKLSGPPPCGVDAWRQLKRANATRLEAFAMFAAERTRDETSGVMLAQASIAAELATQRLAEARSQAVKP
jgi:hypothetical protein